MILKNHSCRHRRHSLYRLAGELDATVLALGHTADDCAESLLRNVLFNGRIGSLPPVDESRRGGFPGVPPLVFVSETLTERHSRVGGLSSLGMGSRDPGNGRPG